MYYIQQQKKAIICDQFNNQVVYYAINVNKIVETKHP